MWTRLMQTLVGSGNRMRKVMTHESTRQVVLLPRAVPRSAGKVLWLRPMGT